MFEGTSRSKQINNVLLTTLTTLYNTDDDVAGFTISVVDNTTTASGARTSKSLRSLSPSSTMGMHCTPRCHPQAFWESCNLLHLPEPFLPATGQKAGRDE